MKISDEDLDLIEKYHLDNLSETEKGLFEKRMTEEPAFKRRVEIFQSIQAVFKTDAYDMKRDYVRNMHDELVGLEGEAKAYLGYKRIKWMQRGLILLGLIGAFFLGKFLTKNPPPSETVAQKEEIPMAGKLKFNVIASLEIPVYVIDNQNNIQPKNELLNLKIGLSELSEYAYNLEGQYLNLSALQNRTYTQNEFLYVQSENDTKFYLRFNNEVYELQETPGNDFYLLIRSQNNEINNSIINFNNN